VPCLDFPFFSLPNNIARNKKIKMKIDFTREKIQIEFFSLHTVEAAEGKRTISRQDAFQRRDLRFIVGGSD
jgi:hypothetical protein